MVQYTLFNRKNQRRTLGAKYVMFVDQEEGGSRARTPEYCATM